MPTLEERADVAKNDSGQECVTAPTAQRETLARKSTTRDVSGWVLGAALAILCAMAWPWLRGEVYLADDLGEFHLPVRNFYSQQLARGESFDWMPTLYGGFYIGAEGQLGGYHPWHLLLYQSLPLETAFNLELLASYPLLLLGSFVFMRRLFAQRDAAWFGALVFTFGSFCLLHFVHPNAIAVVAHLPWMLAALDGLLVSENRRTRWLCVAALAALLGSQLLLGYPQYVWFSLLACMALAGIRIAAAKSTAPLLPAGLAVGIGLMIGAAQWMPTWHLLGQSVRQSHDAAFTATGSLHPLNLLQTLAPYLFATRVVGQNTHELGLYLGAVPFVLVVWLLSQSQTWGPRRPVILTVLALALAALLLASGEFGPIHWLQSWLPVVNRFRFPARAIVLLQLALAVAAAIGWTMLAESSTATQTMHRRGMLWLLTIVALSVMTAGVVPRIWPQHVAAPVFVWTGPVLIALAATLVILAQTGKRLAMVLLVLLTAGDLGAYGLSYAILGRSARLADYVASSPRAPQQAPARVVAPHESAPRVGNRMLLTGSTRVDGYAGLEPAKRLDYREPYAWKLAGAEFVFVRPSDLPDKRCQWIKLTSTAPRARMITRSVQLAELADGYQDDAAHAEPSTPLPRSTPGQATILTDRPGRICLQNKTPARQMLLLTESFDPGWQVTIDGQPAPIVRMNGDFLGCAVEAGRHEVQFAFEPRCRSWGLATAGCGLGFLMAALAWGVVGPRGRPLEETKK